MLQTMRKTSDLIWQDAQHQVLFETLDLIKRPGADSKVLLKLKDYTENHFSLEERYMVELEYPGRKAHIEAHNLFRIEIVQLVECSQPDALVRELMATYLTEWLKRHVFGIDKDLEDFILQSGSR
jgi:hemerythrin